MRIEPRINVDNEGDFVLKLSREELAILIECTGTTMLQVEERINKAKALQLLASFVPSLKKQPGILAKLITHMTDVYNPIKAMAETFLEMPDRPKFDKIKAVYEFMGEAEKAL